MSASPTSSSLDSSLKRKAPETSLVYPIHAKRGPKRRPCIDPQIELRRERNRISAQKCRERKRYYVTEMERRISDLRAENAGFSTSLKTMDPEKYDKVVETLKTHRRQFPMYVPAYDIEQDVGNPDSKEEAVQLGEALQTTRPYFIITTGCDESGRCKIVSVSKDFEMVTGYSSSQACGRNPDFLQTCQTRHKSQSRCSTTPKVPRITPARIDKLTLAMQNGQAESTTKRHYSRNGIAYWARIIMLPLVGEKGDISYFVRHHYIVNTHYMKMLMEEETVVQEQRLCGGDEFDEFEDEM